MRPKLAIGTANFGMAYGISEAGTKKKVTQKEIGRILSLGALAGIDILDTASLYGSACHALGSHAKLVKNSDYKIIYKLPKLSRDISSTALDDLKKVFFDDLSKMKTKHVYCIMVHDALDLLKNGAYFYWEFLKDLKTKGFCRKLGVSVYDPIEMIEVTSKYDIKVCQFPASVFDQRFDKALISSMKEISKIEFHARSIFLQGLLHMNPDQIPAKFAEVKYKLSLLKEMGTNPIDATLEYVSSLDIDHIVVGFNHVEQLNELLIRYRYLKYELDYSNIAIFDPNIVNPNLW